ncbi:MAG: glycosyl hydrolase family 8 [Chitinispirillia bacterium]|nr:glycosyl hydrolase family 8 [Chitinispirillia bacterium]MCL2241497.1 glycosyl hydrolase family 8 [Chitinispirillia bacterium]
MSRKSLKTAVVMLFLVAAAAYPQYKPLYYRSMPKVSANYDTVIQKTWEGIKKRNVDAYSTGLVHRPKSNQPHDAVSEGVSYGMLLALYCNDQAYFNKIWNAGEQYMWVSTGYPVGNYYDWRVSRTGAKTGTGPASDADQDIALLLIYADLLVKRGIWTAGYKSTKGADYAARAKDILQTVRTSMVENNYLLPGHWGQSGGYGGADTKNPGYFAPAFYRVFAEFDPDNKDAWMALVDGSYELIKKSPGYARGLIPDWCKMDGSSTGGAGYNAYYDGDALYRDAIRVYWRLGTDYLWYKEPRAKEFLDNAMAFIEGKGGPSAVNFYNMAGSLLPAGDTEVLAIGDGDIERTRREHSHLTAGMWAAAAIGTGDLALAEKYSGKLLEFYKPGTDYWGHAADPGPGTTIPGKDKIFYEDTLHNEMYFDQFLAWFGASMVGGTFTNVWDDLKSGIPMGPPSWKVLPPNPLSNWNINASEAPFTIRPADAAFSHAVRWTVTLTHDSIPGHTRTFTGNSDAVDITWYGLTESGAYMPQGFYRLDIAAQGLEYSTRVWLGRPWAGDAPNLRQGNRLLVDDFADGNIIPYIGRVWETYSDANNDNGSSGAVFNPTAGSGGAGSQLEWTYNVRNGASYPFVSLNWACKSSSGAVMDLRGVDSIIFVARSKTSQLDVAVHLIDTDDPQDYRYFEKSITLTTSSAAASKTHALRLSSDNFKQRLEGTGRDFNTSLSKMVAIRLHLQPDVGSAQASDAIIVERMYLAGPDNVLSKLYTPPAPPPDYIAPPEEPISVKYRAGRADKKYSIRRSGSSVRITLPNNMAEANASIIDVKGRVVGKMTVSSGGLLNINAGNLAKGMYFVEIRKSGIAPLRVPLNNIR